MQDALEKVRAEGGDAHEANGDVGEKKKKKKKDKKRAAEEEEVVVANGRAHCCLLIVKSWRLTYPH